MFSHIVVGAIDLEKSRIFYDKIFAELNIGPATHYGDDRIFYVLPACSP